jgi:hypothetical protein
VKDAARIKERVKGIAMMKFMRITKKSEDDVEENSDTETYGMVKVGGRGQIQHMYKLTCEKSHRMDYLCKSGTVYTVLNRIIIPFANKI